MLQDIRIVKGARRIVLLAKGDKFTVVRRSSDCGQVYNAMPKDGPVGGGQWCATFDTAGVEYVARWYSRSYARSIYRRLVAEAVEMEVGA